MSTNRSHTFIVLLMASAIACSWGPPVLTQLVKARRIAASLHVHFVHAVDQSSQAVLADTDDGASAAAREATQSTATVAQELDDLKRIVDGRGFTAEATLVAQFADAFAQYRQVDSEILSLAVENTNSKARRLTFGAARDAAQRFRRLLDPIAGARGGHGCCLAAAASRAEAAVFELQAIEPRHIDEADAAAMTAMEQEMKTAATTAKSALAELRAGGARDASIDDAQHALDQLLSANEEVVTLSRRNTDVRSTALSLGRKRTLAAHCTDLLQQLEDTLARHEFAGTR
jgi:hypothetical protein